MVFPHPEQQGVQAGKLQRLIILLRLSEQFSKDLQLIVFAHDFFQAAARAHG